MDFRSGRELSHYRLGEKIGEGGMGVVYQALDTRLGRQVAIKLLPAELTADPQRRARFLREARAAAAITHPRIATIHEIDEADGVTFIVMELVEGRTLRSLVSAGPVPVPQAIRFAAEIADGLSEAHGAGIIHRDLKPDNVIIGPAQHVKILDFGLAKLVEPRGPMGARASQAETLLGEMTQEGTIMGTPAYMSPEQAQGLAVGPQSDIFSFGIMLYELVTGEVPFRGPSQIETLAAILRQPPKPASQINPRVPPALDRILGKCLEKDAAARYASAADLRSELEQFDEPTRISPRVLPGFQRRAWRIVGVAAVLVAVIALLSLADWRGWLLGGVVSQRIGSLAVLPLQNLSNDPEQEYFAEGMTDQLITDLSRIGALRVISRTSSGRYKGTQKSLPEIARELTVDAVVEGSVLRSGERVRIAANLIHAVNDQSLWAESYERHLRDVLTLQAEVAKAIVRQIRVRLTAEEQERLGAARSVDPKALDLYLKGRHEANKYTEQGLRRALEYFIEASQADPTYALAYVGIADAYYDMSSLYMDPSEALPQARIAVEQALALETDLAEAYTTRGAIYHSHDWDWKRAEQDFQRALALNPGSSMAHNRYGLLLLMLGRTRESREEMRQAKDSDPLSAYAAVGAAWPCFFAPQAERQYDRAVEILQQAIVMEPDFANAHSTLGFVYEQTGEFARATEALEAAVRLSGGASGMKAALGRAYASAGERDKAEAVLREVLESGKRGHVPPSDIARLYTALGNNEQAFQWLETSYRKRDEALLLAKVDPRFDPLRSDARFTDLLQRLNLTP